jgi:hypothetical protein
MNSSRPSASVFLAITLFVAVLGVPQPVSAQILGKKCDVDTVTTSNGLTCARNVKKKLVWIKTPNGVAPINVGSGTEAPKPLPDPCKMFDNVALEKAFERVGEPRATITSPNLRVCELNPFVLKANDRVFVGRWTADASGKRSMNLNPPNPFQTIGALVEASSVVVEKIGDLSIYTQTAKGVSPDGDGTFVWSPRKDGAILGFFASGAIGPEALKVVSTELQRSASFSGGDAIR